MTTPEADAVAAGLTKAQRLLLPHMSDGGMVYPLPMIADGVVATIREARAAVAGLRALGLAQHGPLYDEDDGRLKGSGTWLTPLGQQVAARLQETSDVG
jgi:hypothetical protein